MKRIQLRNLGRASSELSPLNSPSTSFNNGQQSTFSYGSIRPYFGFLRNSMSRPTSIQTLNRYGDSMGSLGHRALLQYIDSNDLPGLKTFLDTRHLPVDDRDENGVTVLMIAAGRGLAPFVREFIARGADVNAEDLDNWTALLYAAKNGHLDVVQMLIEHDADIEHRDMGSWTALVWSAYKGHAQTVALLLEKGADIFAHGNYHLGPLLWAAGRGHKDIVQMLIQRGAKINVGDKYGTTALVWACRKGHADIVEILLKAGANVDTAGMYSWTPLLVAASGGYSEIVTLLLDKRPNVNALDKDGLTALAIAAKEGFQEIATSLMSAAAYINIQDRAGDTPLIHAVKGCHRGVVEALLKKHADVDIQGKDRKTALYTAVEKGHTGIVKFLLSSNPDLELATKDGDTPLLRAVRNRNLESVQLLLDRRAKVSASDRRGDTCLHIAMRARSKAIVEALLRNPKNSQLLYRANKSGETPYAIDTLHQKTIMGQVFGARRLNANEDSEGMLGYELYSSALADVLSEPTLSTPITVGLYAKWGSGKSFLLTKLREEMHNFARQWAEPPVKAQWLLFLVCLHISILFGTIIGLGSWSGIWGACTAVTFLLVVYFLILLIKFLGRRYDADWAFSVYRGIGKRIGRLRLILQVAFCHPPGAQSDSQPKPVRFHFAEASSASPTGEGSVGHMLALLFEAIELHYGSLATRLYRAFRPKPLKSSSGTRLRRMCCVPIVLMFEICLLTLISGIALIVVYFAYPHQINQDSILVGIYVVFAFLATAICANLHIWAKALGYVFVSQSKHLRKAMRNNEGAPLTALGAEVALMADMVKCLDSFTNQQSRLVGIVDALDSCDTERILSVLSSVQTLLMSPSRPFVLLIAVDPHVIAKAAEANSRRLFTEGGIGGHDFLRNLVHLPVYLQNSGLRKVQRAQMTALAFKRNYPDSQTDEPGLSHSASARRLSNASEIMSSQEKLRTPHNSGRGGSKKLRLSESVASSVASNLHRLGQNQQGVLDLSKIILTDDYFSDVNPRSMRRLMNVIYITVRLLKAFQIEFSWYRLSSWVNLTEQWPMRASLIVLQHEQSGDSLEDTVSLQAVYDKVRQKIPYLREAAPLLELDRDERKLDAFLQLHKSDLLVADLRIFLPFTINLDPYLRKVLKEDQQAFEDEGGIVMQSKPGLPQMRLPQTPPLPSQFAPASYPQLQYPFDPFYYSANAVSVAPPNNQGSESVRRRKVQEANEAMFSSSSATAGNENAFSEDILQMHLSELSTDGVIALIDRIEDLKPTLPKLEVILSQNAINGRVLRHCDLKDLKAVLGLSFGHWELFRLLIETLRSCEKIQSKVRYNPEPANDVADSITIPVSHSRKNSSQMEKQVTLEEQMICGALQTLNEDAYEDVAISERASPSGLPTDLEIVMTSSTNSNPPVTALSAPIAISSRQPESILKPTGSTKTDKRVSIKPNNNVAHMELVCEKRNRSVSASGPRPASLVLTRNNDHPHFKLVRSSSVDYDDGTDTQPLKSDEDESSPLVFIANK